MLRFIAGIFVGAVALTLAGLVIREMDEEIKVGDLIQWKINGSHQFAEPKKVVKIIPAGPTGNVAYLFVDGTKTGIPAKQAIKV